MAPQGSQYGCSIQVGPIIKGGAFFQFWEGPPFVVLEWPYDQFGHFHQSWLPGNPLKNWPGGPQFPPRTADCSVWAVAVKLTMDPRWPEKARNEGIFNDKEK
ncbi:hypothetical protein O181_025679 [Austropuccinia psidii MF-1]|uniref:Uncharacterized protein n=1 Tax=Austropuccinia psidii MF-1 TaxID=1389203 RepID=A0A9Q3H0W2_9BASI|nr:hypothetical protein [Austropuccinia psidii MF-1]